MAVFVQHETEKRETIMAPPRSAAPLDALPEEPGVIDKTTPAEPARIVERPDGFYWFDDTTGAPFGPFKTYAEAQADANATEDAELALEPGRALHEIEEEIGLADWIDPETGQPAEDYSPHIEDH